MGIPSPHVSAWTEGPIAVELEKRYRLSRQEYHLLLDRFAWSQESRVCDLTLGLSGPTSMQTHGWVIRLRRSVSGNRMEYKAPLNPEWTAWREYSTDIGNFGQCISILLAVGLKPGLLLDRTRRVATYNSATLSLDNVRELGYFLEIEVEANDTSDQTALNVIHHIRERLGLNGKPEERPYGEIMLSRLASDDLLQSRHENLVKNLLLELDD